MATTVASLTKFWRERPLLTRIALVMFIIVAGLMVAIMLVGAGIIIYDMATTA